MTDDTTDTTATVEPTTLEETLVTLEELWFAVAMKRAEGGTRAYPRPPLAMTGGKRARCI